MHATSSLDIVLLIAISRSALVRLASRYGTVRLCIRPLRKGRHEVGSFGLAKPATRGTIEANQTGMGFPRLYAINF
jgi:hypothetical protein